MMNLAPSWMDVAGLACDPRISKENRDELIVDMAIRFHVLCLEADEHGVIEVPEHWKLPHRGPHGAALAEFMREKGANDPHEMDFTDTLAHFKQQSEDSENRVQEKQGANGPHEMDFTDTLAHFKQQSEDN